MSGDSILNEPRVRLRRARRSITYFAAVTLALRRDLYRAAVFL